MYETHVTVQGRLVADPVVKQDRNGAPFTTFRVAQSERHPVRGEQGRWTDSEPSYYDVSAFRGIGDNAARSLRKGHPVVVLGRLRVRSYSRGDGSSGTAVEIDAQSLGHDLRWGSTAYTRNGDLAPALPGAPPHGEEPGDPGRDPYVVTDGSFPGPSAPGEVAREDGRADTGPLVPPGREQAA